MKKLAGLVFVLFAFVSTSHAQQKKRVAVMNFDYSTVHSTVLSIWGADQDTMFKSIRQRIFSLDADTRLCPGHGPESSVGTEKRENPFFQ